MMAIEESVDSVLLGIVKANPLLKAIPVIAVTSYSLSGDDEKAFEAGCDAYIPKPFSPRALLAKIREYLSVR